MAAVLGAFADGEDIGIRGAHLVVDDNAALDHQARRLGRLDVGADTDSHNQQRGRNDAAVLQLQALDMGLADNSFGLGVEYRNDAAVEQGLFEQSAGGFVELALHQHVDQMNDGRLHAALGQAVGGFETEQPAADDNSLAAPIGRCGHQVDIQQVAKGDDAIQVGAWQG